MDVVIYCLSSIYVPGPLTRRPCCGGLQERPPELPTACRPNSPFQSIHCGVRADAARSALPARPRIFLGRIDQMVDAPETGRGKLMFDPDANMPRINRGWWYLAGMPDRGHPPGARTAGQHPGCSDRTGHPRIRGSGVRGFQSGVS